MCSWPSSAPPLPGLITPYRERIEWHLRAASLRVELAVGILSLVAVVRKLRWRGRTLNVMSPRHCGEFDQGLRFILR
jgi:hypothetical protein